MSVILPMTARNRSQHIETAYGCVAHADMQLDVGERLSVLTCRIEPSAGAGVGGKLEG